ncbi:MAG: aminotransferase class I/II-fold pyridoxal phosphate-dependent enzyme [Desulfobacteraceae bacterium]|jgi:8-amino-7-oxononanoate synthase
MGMIMDRFRHKLDVQRKSGLFRDPPVIDRREGKYVFSNGTRLLNFASNDYLGLGASDALRRKVARNFERYGASSSSSRLVSGNYALIRQAEAAYAQHFGYEAALFYPSGYQANLGVLSTLFQPGDTVVFDKHIHASSVKGLVLSGAKVRGYNHSSFAHLERRLRYSIGPVGVVTESLFSMDGDCLDCEAMQALRKSYEFLCVVDEAHAFGAVGPGGRGLAAAVADVAVGTFGKALGLFGAFALMSSELKSYLLNFSSAQIYTTTLPEAHAASALDVLDLIGVAEVKRQHLRDLGRYFAQSMKSRGFPVSGDAHIMAVEIGDEQIAVEMTRKLHSSGLFILPARYPTVPLQKAILRVSLTALHQRKDVDLLVNKLEEARSG